MNTPKPLVNRPSPEAARVAGELLRGWLREGNPTPGVRPPVSAPDPKAEVRPPRK